MRRVLWLLGGLLLLPTLGTVFALRPQEYARTPSPDRRYIAVARHRAFRSWLVSMPGSGGDKPGWIELQDSAGLRIARADVPMVSLLYDLRWSATEAWLPGGPTWPLR
jgi:hypothetical protein